jgi:hypothetical protein
MTCEKQKYRKFSKLLPVYLRTFPTEFIPKTNKEQVKYIANYLPPLSGAILEYHLSSNCQCDFSLRATHTDGGREFTAGHNSRYQMHKKLLQFKEWQCIQTFGTKWADPTTLLHTGIQNIWFEFDIDNNLKILIPSVFFDVDRGNRFPGNKKLKIITKSVSYLKGEQISPEHVKIIKMILAALPGQSKLYYIGVMLSRPTEALRICVRDILPKEILPFLKKIGWHENASILKTLIKNYINDAQRYILNFDIDLSIQKKIGLEINNPEWETILDKLIVNNLCSSEEKMVLLNWRKTEPIDPNKKSHQKILEEIIEPIGCLIRRINHFKIVCDDDSSLKAKAYLYMAYA